MFRIGIGYDLHCFVEGRPLVLAGVTIPYRWGLGGHSDGDALAHAVTDALLGAAALGNIGMHFPDTDPAYEGADSMKLLKEAVGMVQEKGYKVSCVDSNLIADNPKFAPHLDEMCASLAACLETDVDRISVKAKTNEGVGPEGEGRAISTHAIVLLEKA